MLAGSLRAMLPTCKPPPVKAALTLTIGEGADAITHPHAFAGSALDVAAWLRRQAAVLEQVAPVLSTTLGPEAGQ